MMVTVVVLVLTTVVEYHPCATAVVCVGVLPRQSVGSVVVGWVFASFHGFNGSYKLGTL